MIGICFGFLAISFLHGACGGGTSTPAEVLTAPTLETIRAALSLNNSFGIVPGLALGEITLPECTGANDPEDVTYELANTPDWLSFDATTRALTLATGTQVPQEAYTLEEVEYTCTETTGSTTAPVPTPTSTSTSKATTSTASVSFPVNDLDGGGVVDGREYDFSELPLLNRSVGWVWLTPEDTDLYRTSVETAIPTGIIATAAGMDLTDATDDTGDFDGDGTNNGDEITNETNMFVATSTGTFADSGSNPAAGASAKEIATADLDNDGDLDLVVTNEDGATFHSIRPLINDGSGSFTPGNDYDAVDAPQGLAAADFNGDGNIDIAAANNVAPGSVSVLLGNGDGTFAGQVPYSVGNEPSGVIAADLDGDNDIDLAVANSDSDNVSILLGAGDGTFGTATNVAAGDAPENLVFADFDGDGDLDLAVTNAVATSKTVSILANNGSGSFTLSSALGVEDSPNDLTAADFNDDGAIDIATMNWDGNQGISLLMNNGDGTFAAYTPIAFGNAKPFYIVASDLDGDGDIDLAGTQSQDDTTSYLLNDGDATFAALQTIGVGTNPRGIVAADLNGNGKMDLATVNNGDSDLSISLGQ